MKFKVKKRQRTPKYAFPEESYKIARDFSKRLYKEFGDFIKLVVLFGYN